MALASSMKAALAVMPLGAVSARSTLDAPGPSRPSHARWSARRRLGRCCPSRTASSYPAQSERSEWRDQSERRSGGDVGFEQT